MGSVPGPIFSLVARVRRKFVFVEGQQRFIIKLYSHPASLPLDCNSHFQIISPPLRGRCPTAEVYILSDRGGVFYFWGEGGGEVNPSSGAEAPPSPARGEGNNERDIWSPEDRIFKK